MSRRVAGRGEVVSTSLVPMRSLWVGEYKPLLVLAGLTLFELQTGLCQCQERSLWVGECKLLLQLAGLT